MSAAIDLAQAAQDYATRLRWPVFPIHPIGPDGLCAGCGGEQCAGKHPVTKGWERTICGGEATAAIWRPQLGDRGIGLPCGTRSGVWALDVDERTGGPSTLKRLERDHGRLPDTWRSQTGSGQHVLFQAADDRVRNSAGQVGDGLDVRGAGGFVVLPPSPHRSGSRYEWLTAPWDTRVAVAPDWLLTLALARPKRRFGGSNGSAPQAPLIPGGQRDDALAAFCGWLRSAGFYEETIVDCGLSFLRRQCAQEPPMDLKKAERNIRGIARRYPPYINRDGAF
jgi:Bifunctional DNA primase/polymerase, N-terminal